MPHKSLLLTFVALLIIGGVVFLLMKKNITLPQTGQEKIIPIESSQSMDVSDKEKAEQYAESWSGDTSQWKLYQNKEAGIEIKYPEEVFSFWEIKLDNMNADPTPQPLELHFKLTQKGYQIDDYKHQIWVNLNSLKSDKEYYSEAQRDTITTLVSFGAKTGKVFGTKETIYKLQSDYEMFNMNGVCNPETFTIVFDELRHPLGDLRSYAHVGCEGEAMGKIYQAVFNSITFLNR